MGKATQGSMQARTLYLNKPYGVADLTTELANSEPMQHIRNRYGKYWERQWQRYLLGAARGIIASNIANNSGDMVIDAGATMTADAMQDAAFTAGDAADQFAAIGVHSAVMKQMVKKDLIQYIQDSQGRIILTTYLGKPIFMDDGLTYGSKQYLTMFFGTGAFGYGEGTPANPVGLQRDELGGNGGGSETIVERKLIFYNLLVFLGKAKRIQIKHQQLANIRTAQIGNECSTVNLSHLLQLFLAHLNKHGDFGRLCFWR